MLILIYKITIVSLICLITSVLLFANKHNLKQKFIVFGFMTCLLIPILSLLPWSININNLFSGLITSNNTSHTIVSSETKNITPNIHTEFIIVPNSVQLSQKTKTINTTTVLYTLLTIIWLSGLMIKLLVYIYQTYQLKKMINRSGKLTLQTNIQSINNKPVKYIISGSTLVPFLYVGSSEIKVVLPERSRNWPIEYIQNIILHELCHYRRKDHWAMWLSSVVSIVYWFHPLLMRLIKTQKELIELACDQQLIDEGISPTSYADTILSIPENINNLSIVPLMATSPSMLKKRIAGILMYKKVKFGFYKSSLLALIMAMILLTSCMNNSPLLSANNLAEFLSYDLPSFRSAKVEKGHFHISTFYDGTDNNNTYLSLELSKEDSNQTTWLNVGPLKKFDEQIQTWQYKVKNDGFLTGNYKITGALDDGTIDGVAMGIIYANKKGETQIHKSIGLIENGIPNILCSWPIDFSNEQIRQMSPQLSQYNPESIKRLLCGAQLIKNGSYSMNKI